MDWKACIEEGNMRVEIGNIQELTGRIPEVLKKDAYAYIVCSDKIFWTNGELDDVDINKLKELRIFNANGEYRLLRPNLGVSFFERVIQSDAKLDYFDQWHYLDIDGTSINDDNTVSTISGGKYRLPVTASANLLIKIRNYVAYDEKSGQARVNDWRLVEFGEESANGRVSNK